MSKQIELLQSGAIFNQDRTHRYVLWRMWDLNKPAIAFIGLNPSRADETKDDKTIIRCKNFAVDWGYGRMYFLNLYSFRTPYVHGPIPEHLKIYEEIEWQPLHDNLSVAVAENYNKYFAAYEKDADTTVCCWGSFPFITDRAKEVLAMINEPYCFGSNANGQPKHPLYLAKTTKLIQYVKDKS